MTPRPRSGRAGPHGADLSISDVEAARACEIEWLAVRASASRSTPDNPGGRRVAAGANAPSRTTYHCAMGQRATGARCRRGDGAVLSRTCSSEWAGCVERSPYRARLRDNGSGSRTPRVRVHGRHTVRHDDDIFTVSAVRNPPSDGSGGMAVVSRERTRTARGSR